MSSLMEVKQSKLEKEGLKRGEYPTPRTLEKFKKIPSLARRGHGVHEKYTR